MPRRRLAAIREFSDLGRASQIAALDLKLRGAEISLAASSRVIWTPSASIFTHRCSNAQWPNCVGEAVEDETAVSTNLGADVAIPEGLYSRYGPAFADL